MVFDVYRELSIKNVKRSKGSNDDPPMFSQIVPDRNIKQWARFLKGSNNKSKLIEGMGKSSIHKSTKRFSLSDWLWQRVCKVVKLWHSRDT